MNPKDFAEWASVAQQAGGWGIALLTWVFIVRPLYKALEDSRQAQIDHGKIFGAALQDSAKATDKQNEIIVDLTAQVSELKLEMQHLKVARGRG